MTPLPKRELRMDCRCERGWICEEHDDQPWPHDGCFAGMPCTNPECPWWADIRRWPASWNTPA